LANILLQFAGAVSVICGFVVVYFLLVVHISLKRLGGSLEKRHIYTISAVALTFLSLGILLSFLGRVSAWFLSYIYPLVL